MPYILPPEIWIYMLDFLDDSAMNLFFVNKFFFSLVPLSKNNTNMTEYLLKKGYLDAIKYINHLKSIKNNITLDHNKFKPITIKQALLESCQYGHTNLVKYLVTMGANIRTDDHYPLLLASKYGHYRLVKYLVNNGCDLRANHYAAFCSASEHGHLRIVNFFINIGKINVEKRYALKSACINGHLNIVKSLVKNGANIRAYDDEALGESCKHGHLNIVMFLVEKGANVKANNNYAIRMAELYNHFDVRDYLYKHGGRPYKYKYDATGIQHGPIQPICYIRVVNPYKSI